MDKVQSDLGELKTQGATVAESLKAMTETLQGLKLWMPRVDGAIGSLQQEIKEVGDRVAMLEATKTAMDEVTPVGEEVHHEVGARSAAIRNKAPAAQFPRGKRILHHTPVQFDLGDQSLQEEEIDGSAILESRSTRYSNGGSSARMPRQISQNLMERTPSGGKVLLRSISPCTMCLEKLGQDLLQCISRVMQHYGCKHMRLSTKLKVGKN